MEFVVIEYPDRRRVRMDNTVFGFTQAVLQCRAGRHDFDLGTPKDYTPLSQHVEVGGTSAPQPMRIRFQPRTAAFITIAPLAAGAAPSARRAKGARTKGPVRKRKKSPRKRRQSR